MLRPEIVISGEVSQDVSDDVTSFTLTEKTKSCEIALNDIRPSGGTYSDSELFEIGTRIAIFMRDGLSRGQQIFDGRIKVLAGEFPDGDSPKFIIVATQVRFPVSSLKINVRIGNELLEFYPKIERKNVNCSGVLDGDPRIKRGTSLFVSGAGSLFNREYIVESTVHTFDTSRGYRTEFVASS